MAQHGEERAVVRAVPSRFKRRLRSAATAALSAGLAFSFVAATALPPALGHRMFPSAIVASATGSVSAVLDAPASGRPSRPLPPPVAGPLATAPTSKFSSENAGKADASYSAASVLSPASFSAICVASTPSRRLLRFGTKASRTRGRPDLG